jgi:hypothetical protein
MLGGFSFLRTQYQLRNDVTASLLPLIVPLPQILRLCAELDLTLWALPAVTFESPPPRDIPVVTVTTHLQQSCILPPRVPPGGHTFPRRSAPETSPQWSLHFRFTSPPSLLECPAVSSSFFNPIIGQCD